MDEPCALEEGSHLGVGPLSSVEHAEHGEVDHLGHVWLAAGGHDEFERKDAGSGRGGGADVGEQPGRVGVVPVVEDHGQEVGVGSTGHRVEEAAGLCGEAIIFPGLGCDLGPYYQVYDLTTM